MRLAYIRLEYLDPVGILFGLGCASVKGDCTLSVFCLRVLFCKHMLFHEDISQALTVGACRLFATCRCIEVGHVFSVLQSIDGVWLDNAVMVSEQS